MEDEFKEIFENGLKIEVYKVDGELQVKLEDKFETSGITLFGKEIWWVFNQLHYIHQKFIGDF